MEKREYYIICIDDQAWTYSPCHQDALGGPGTFDSEELLNHHRQASPAKKTARPVMHKTSEWYMGKAEKLVLAIVSWQAFIRARSHSG